MDKQEKESGIESRANPITGYKEKPFSFNPLKLLEQGSSSEEEKQQ